MGVPQMVQISKSNEDQRNWDLGSTQETFFSFPFMQEYNWVEMKTCGNFKVFDGPVEMKTSIG